MEENNEKAEIYSQRIRAGKRTYFFDVKSTRSNDYYLTITESKRKFKDETYSYEKHKIFLYKEDFDKFAEGLNETIAHIRTIAPATTASETASSDGADATYSDLKFEDLSGEPAKD